MAVAIAAAVAAALKAAGIGAPAPTTKAAPQYEEPKLLTRKDAEKAALKYAQDTHGELPEDEDSAEYKIWVRSYNKGLNHYEDQRTTHNAKVTAQAQQAPLLEALFQTKSALLVERAMRDAPDEVKEALEAEVYQEMLDTNSPKVSTTRIRELAANITGAQGKASTEGLARGLRTNPKLAQEFAEFIAAKRKAEGRPVQGSATSASRSVKPKMQPYKSVSRRKLIEDSLASIQ